MLKYYGRLYDSFVKLLENMIEFILHGLLIWNTKK